MTLISCLDYGKGYVQCSHTPYLLKCGVLHRLFSLGFCQNLVVDKRNQLHAFLFCKWVESAPVSKKFDCMIEDRWKCQNCGNSVPDGLTVCPKCGLVKGGFDELPKHTADGLEIARVEQKVKVEIPFILYLGTVCSIILLAIVVYIYVAIKL